MHSLTGACQEETRPAPAIRRRRDGALVGTTRCYAVVPHADHLRVPKATMWSQEAGPAVGIRQPVSPLVE